MTAVDWSGFEWLIEEVTTPSDIAPKRATLRPDSARMHPLFDPHVPDWMDRGICSSHPHGDLWFPSNGQPNGTAISLCRVCPVRDECTDYADAMTDAGRNPDGIWGGLTRVDRARRRKEREQRDRRADHTHQS